VVRFRFLWHGADNSNAARYDQGGGRTDKFFIIGGLCNAARSRVWRRFGRSMSVCEALLGARSWVRTGWWTSFSNLLFAGGHVLLTDIPGVDKTTLSGPSPPRSWRTYHASGSPRTRYRRTSRGRARLARDTL
jgi:hypothetical protein